MTSAGRFINTVIVVPICLVATGRLFALYASKTFRLFAERPFMLAAIADGFGLRLRVDVPRSRR